MGKHYCIECEAPFERPDIPTGTHPLTCSVKCSDRRHSRKNRMRYHQKKKSNPKRPCDLRRDAFRAASELCLRNAERMKVCGEQEAYIALLATADAIMLIDAETESSHLPPPRRNEDMQYQCQQCKGAYFPKREGEPCPWCQSAAAEKRATEAEAKCGLLAALWTGHARTSREEAARIRQTVKVATEAEANCNIRAEVWARCAEQLGNSARAQAVAEVLANAKEIYSDHNANDPRDEDASDCWCGTCNAVRKLAALDGGKE